MQTNSSPSESASGWPDREIEIHQVPGHFEFVLLCSGVLRHTHKNYYPDLWVQYLGREMHFREMLGVLHIKSFFLKHDPFFFWNVSFKFNVTCGFEVSTKKWQLRFCLLKCTTTNQVIKYLPRGHTEFPLRWTSLVSSPLIFLLRSNYGRFSGCWENKQAEPD